MNFESLCQGLHDSGHALDPNPPFQLVVDGAEALRRKAPEAAIGAEAPRCPGGGEDFGELGIQTGHELAGVVDHLATPGEIHGKSHGKWWIEINRNQ